MRPPVTTNGNAVCAKSLVSNAQCVRIKLHQVSDNLIERHLRGTISTGAPFVMGFYPMLPDGTCCLLVADFDREDWRATHWLM